MNKMPLMPLLSHIVELRKQLIAILIVFAVCLAGGLFAAPYVLDYIKSSPPASGLEWNVFSPFDGVRMYMNIALVIASIVTLPTALYLLWGFVKQGLHPHERSAALRYVPYSAVSLIIGIAFGYSVLLPISYAFVSDISTKLNLVETYGATQYFSFMLNIVLPIAAAFELPIVVMFLTRIGLLTPDRLRKSRRYAYLVLVIVANLISPPDFVSAFIILIPLCGLFELSVLLSRSAFRKRAALQAELPAV
ncbi:twin-arginine translocase subunit TatC [Paenibacillus soyae]|uniref:Sec-independent protein translocase protein TatC n=1 Tax=Paenibacillus soyae TaxID=2969249 RepID=A0A9X2MVY9_9BACL|nr:twin-arginine translocase subunit TatC [Paenibacillus soyae]MCR2804657.1 twin-arginine translocase subunit TatC [Paenibacillus soyae]